MKPIVFIVLSPTWVIADSVKEQVGRTRFLRLWRWCFFCLAIGTCVLLFFAKVEPIEFDLRSKVDYVLAAYLWLIPFSRANELWLGFGRDAFAQLRHETPHTPADRPERIKLLMRSYGEAVLDFAIMYFLVPRSCFEPKVAFGDIVDAVYFSGTTITTLGFGDITPVCPLSKLLVLLEVFTGFVLVILALGAYLGGGNEAGVRR